MRMFCAKRMEQHVIFEYNMTTSHTTHAHNYKTYKFVASGRRNPETIYMFTKGSKRVCPKKSWKRESGHIANFEIAYFDQREQIQTGRMDDGRAHNKFVASGRRIPKTAHSCCMGSKFI